MLQSIWETRAQYCSGQHKVKSTKKILRGQHGQLNDLTVEKATLGSDILEIIEGHDRAAMLTLEDGGRTSHRYLTEEQKMKIRHEIDLKDPFSKNRGKVDYFDEVRGMFSGLSVDQIERFLERNMKLYKRNSPHRFENVS